MTVAELLANAQYAINASLQLSKQEAALEARMLVQHHFKVSRAWLIAHDNDVVEENHNIALNALVKRRINGEPIAYILGEREFYGLPLTVSSDTLIPRPDTETLVDAALSKIHANTNKVLDLGTGTGAIALAIAHSRPDVNVLGVDISEGALKVARQNAVSLAIENAAFLLSNWFNALGQQSFDLIVSNPPYIEENDPHLIQGDLRFEPRSALASGADGLDDIRHIIKDAPTHLNKNGWLMFEHGYNQAEHVQQLLKAAGFTAIETIQDLGQNDRVIIGQLAV